MGMKAEELIREWVGEYGIDAVFGGYRDNFRFGVAGSCVGAKHTDPYRSRYGVIYINSKLEGKSSE